jgi:O-antigen ligase
MRDGDQPDRGERTASLDSSPTLFRDPLIYLVPLALAFPPLLAYGGSTLGWPGGWLSTRVALVASVGVFLFLRLVRRDFTYRQIPGLTFVLPYLLLVIASALWSVLGLYNAEASVIANELLTWLILVTVFVLLAGSFHRERDLRAAGRVLVAVAMIQVVYAGFQALVFLGMERFVPAPIVAVTQYARRDLDFGSLRLHGTLPNLGPNFFGAFLLVPTVLAFNRSLSQRGWARFAWLIGGISCAGVIGATYSRGALFGLVVALLMIPVWRRSWRGVAGMVVTVATAALIVLQTPVGRHVIELYEFGQLDPSGAARVYLWKAIFKNAADHPLGLGYNAWPRASRVSTDVGLADLPESFGAPHPAENQWMRELADRGIPGVLALALLLGGIVRLTFRATHPNRSAGYARDFLVSAGAASVGWGVVFLTGDHLTYENVAGIFWYASALALATTRDGKLPAAKEVSPALADPVVEST